jgi:hypothetical protein
VSGGIDIDKEGSHGINLAVSTSLKGDVEFRNLLSSILVLLMKLWVYKLRNKSLHFSACSQSVVSQLFRLRRDRGHLFKCLPESGVGFTRFHLGHHRSVEDRIGKASVDVLGKARFHCS